MYGRPIVCTESMARTTGSLAGTHLPVFASRKVGCINWGLVSGKTNTIFAWQDLDNPMNRIDLSSSDECGEPKVWFHDLFRLDGTPYDPAEIEALKMWTRYAPRLQAAGRLSWLNSTMNIPQCNCGMNNTSLVRPAVVLPGVYGGIKNLTTEIRVTEFPFKNFSVSPCLSG